MRLGRVRGERATDFRGWMRVFMRGKLRYLVGSHAQHLFTCLSRGGNTGLMSKQVRIKTGRYRGYRGRVLWVGETEVSIAYSLT